MTVAAKILHFKSLIFKSHHERKMDNVWRDKRKVFFIDKKLPTIKMSRLQFLFPFLLTTRHNSLQLV